MSKQEKKPNTKAYVVMPRKGFPYPQRVRGGITFAAGSETNINLTDEQYQLIKGDSELTIRRADQKPKQEKVNDESTDSLEEAKTNPNGNHSNVAAGDNSGVPVSPDQIDEDQDSEPEKEGDSKPEAGEATVDKNQKIKRLLKSNSETALREQATAAGIANLDQLSSKREIAQALVDQQG